MFNYSFKEAWKNSQVKPEDRKMVDGKTYAPLCCPKCGEVFKGEFSFLTEADHATGQYMFSAGICVCQNCKTGFYAPHQIWLHPQWECFAFEVRNKESVCL